MNMSLRSPPKPANPERGFALVATLCFLLILTVLGIAALATNASQTKMSYASADYSRALQAADSAVAAGEYWLTTQSILPAQNQSCSGSCTPLVWQAGFPLQNYSNSGPSGTAQTWQGFNWSYARSLGANYNADDTSVPRPLTTYQMLRTGGSSSGQLAPLYVIEEIGPDRLSSLDLGQGKQTRRYYYRITAQGKGATSSTAYAQSVFVQSFN